VAVEADAPAVRPQITGDHVQEGRLAGAVGADQADDAVALEFERDVGRRRHGAKALVESLG
jgi:hypothetical protein